MFRFTLPAVALLGLLLAGCAHHDTQMTQGTTRQAILTGNVTYLERIALPPDAELHVWLVDVTPGILTTQVVLAETTVRTDGRQVPIPFELRYDPAKLDLAHDYGVRAVFSSGGRNLFESAEPTRVITKGAPKQVDLRVMRAADGAGTGSPDATALHGTSWRLVEFRGDAAGADPDATLEFLEGGTVAGKGSCNRFTGSVTLTGDRIRFGPLAATLAICPGPTSEQEARYFKALGDAERWQVLGPNLLISLSGSDKVLVFERAR
jgi:putative lipoprotein